MEVGIARHDPLDTVFSHRNRSRRVVNQIGVEIRKFAEDFRRNLCMTVRGKQNAESRRLE